VPNVTPTKVKFQKTIEVTNGEKKNAVLQRKTNVKCNLFKVVQLNKCFYNYGRLCLTWRSCFGAASQLSRR